MSGAIIFDEFQIGQHVTPENNFVWKKNTQGLLELCRGTVDAPGATLIKVNADGGVNLGGPVFSAYKTATQTVAPSAFTKILFDETDYDSHGTYIKASSRFKPSVAGYYQINAMVNTYGGGGGACLVSLFKNGTEHKRGLQGTFSTAIASGVNALVYLNGSTDYAEIHAYAGSPTAIGTDVGGARINYFDGFLVRAA